MEEVEIWKPLSLRPDLYEVSSFGRIRSKDRLTIPNNCFIKGRILKTSISKSGYEIVGITIKDGKRKKYSFKVHRVVAIHFIENPLLKPQVNHKDLNKLNNCASNLEWNTPLENTRHAQINGAIRTAKPKFKVYKGRPKGYKIILDTYTGIFYYPQELCDLYGFKRKEICRQLRGERKNKTKFIYA